MSIFLPEIWRFLKVGIWGIIFGIVLLWDPVCIPPPSPFWGGKAAKNLKTPKPRRTLQIQIWGKRSDMPSQYV